MTKEEVEIKCTEVHNGKYKYILEKNVYHTTDKIVCVCPEHGLFEQLLKSHLKGCGCRQCSQIKNASKTRLSLEQFKEKSFRIHNGKYDESKVEYINASTKVCIICHEKDYNGNEHGEFWITPLHYLSGQGCPKCNKKHYLPEEIKDKCKSTLHGMGISFENSVFVDMETKIKCVCEKHGEFEKYPYQIINRGEGCPKCGFEEKCLKSRKTNEEFIEGVKKVHGDKYDVSGVTYEVGYKTIYPVCHVKYKNGVEHGPFPITPNNFLQGYGCPKCSRMHSNGEIEFSDFISSLEKNVTFEDRDVLNGKEIDLFLPERNIGFEFNGLYWHSDSKKGKNYHLDKTNEAIRNNINLYHVFEDEWLFKKEIVKSRIASLLGQTKNKIFARKCEVKKISSLELKNFLNSNHLQGNVSSKHRYGLYYNNELVSVMSFGHLRKNLGSKGNEDEYELLRFCNKLNTAVVGGASKLLEFFIKDIKPNRIISYADRRWSNGNLYEKLGFKHIRNSKPNYFYVVGHNRENRFKYRKDILVKQGYDPNKSERQIMQERGIYRIYDCGTMVFEMKL